MLAFGDFELRVKDAWRLYTFRIIYPFTHQTALELDGRARIRLMRRIHIHLVIVIAFVFFALFRIATLCLVADQVEDATDARARG